MCVWHAPSVNFTCFKKTFRITLLIHKILKRPSDFLLMMSYYYRMRDSPTKFQTAHVFTDKTCFMMCQNVCSVKT